MSASQSGNPAPAACTGPSARLASRVLFATVLVLLAVTACSRGLSRAPAGQAPQPAATAAGRQILPLVFNSQPKPAVIVPPDTSRSGLGLVWVNSAEEPRGDARIQRGADSGARWDRFPFYWTEVERAAGQFDWSRLDQAVGADERHGLSVMAILLGTPGQYSGGGSRSLGAGGTPRIGGSFLRQSFDEEGGTRAPAACTGPAAPSGLWEPIFTDGSDRPGASKKVNSGNPWARFVDLAAQRYRPGGTGGFHVQLWEVWNEPDLCQFWTGTVSEYARLVKVAYLVIKWRDPAATVLWGGLAHFEQPEFVDGLISNLRNSPMSAEFDGFFDGAAAHHYSVLFNGLEWTGRVRTKLDAVGWQHKPIWITESGVPICNDYPGPACDWQTTFSPWRAQPYEQAAYIWENIAYTRLAGGGPILQFMLHDDCGNVVAPNSPDGFGVVKNESSSYCSPDGAQARVGYRAFQLAAQYLQDTELLWGEVQDGSVRQVAFYHHPTKERRLMTWALTAAGATARVAATGPSARRIAVDGAETSLAPVNGLYQIGLPGYTNRNWWKGGSVYDVGIYGLPYLVIERDTQPPQATLSGIAPQSPPSFAIQWQATDRGSGAGYVEISYETGDGRWRTLGSGLPAAGTVAFTGVAGQHVRFAVIAVDRAGNTTPFAISAETDIVEAPPAAAVTGRVRRVNGTAAAGIAVAVGGVAGTTGTTGDFSLAVPPGTWNVQVAGQTVIAGQVIGGSTSLELLLPAAGNTVVNGGFAAGLTGWQQMGSSPLAVEALPGSSEPALHLATGFVANPGVPGEEGSAGGNSTLYQNVRVPSGQPYLALNLRIDSAETSAGHDWFEVLVGFQGQNTQVLKFSTSRANAPVFVPMSAYAGQSVTLYLNVYQSSPNRRTSAWVDQVTLAVP